MLSFCRWEVACTEPVGSLFLCQNPTPHRQRTSNPLTDQQHDLLPKPLHTPPQRAKMGLRVIDSTSSREKIMKKTLLILLLSLVVGCKGDARTPSTDAVTNEAQRLQGSSKTCSICKNTISRYAVSCPHCGVPFYDQEFKELVIKIGGDCFESPDGTITTLQFHFSSNLTDDHLLELKGIARAANKLSPTTPFLAQISSISVVEQPITDTGLQHLARMLYDRNDFTEASDETGLHSNKNAQISLALGLTKITNDGLRVLRVMPLRRLTLRGTEFTDASIEHLKTTSSLESIDLAGTKVTDMGIAELQKALPNCKISN